MALMVIGFLVMSLLVGPSFSQSTTDTTVGTAGPAVTNAYPTVTAIAAAQNTTQSEYDTIEAVWYSLTYCDYLGYSGKCDPYKSTLRIALDHQSTDVCSAASNLISCLGDNCRYDSDRERSIQIVQTRCDVSEYDTIQKLFYDLTTCTYLSYRSKCDTYQNTLRFALDHGSTEICSAAVNVMNCMDMNCRSNSDRENANQQVRARCSDSTQAACDPTEWYKCTAPRSESDICSYLKCIVDGTSDCDDVIKNAAQAASDTIKQAFPSQDCEGWQFVNETSTPFTTPAVVTPPVSEPDALTSEWFTLTSCSFKETTETCAREKYTLEFSRALHFEVCRNAYIFLECLEDRCQYSKELTRSIMKTRADCSAASKKLSQSNVVINNYIGGEAESRRAKNILEILGIYPDN